MGDRGAAAAGRPGAGAGAAGPQQRHARIAVLGPASGPFDAQAAAADAVDGLPGHALRLADDLLVRVADPGAQRRRLVLCL